MKSHPSAHNREGVRLKVLGPLALLMVLILLGAILVKSHQENRPNTSAQEPVAPADSTAGAAAIETPSPIPRTFRTAPSQTQTEPATERLTALLFDRNATPQARRQSAFGLANIGTDQALAALKAGLTNDLPPYVKAAIAESLGHLSSSEASDLLHQLVTAKDETVARGAARGLAARGDPDAANTLGNLLFNDQTPMSVRTEAALALGDVNLPAAQDFLTRAITQIQDEDIRESVLDGMGRRPFSETEDFFRNYLNSPEVPADAKVLAIEAVRDADGEGIIPFLSNYVNDANPKVRTAAKDALDFLDPEPSKPVPAK